MRKIGVNKFKLIISLLMPALMAGLIFCCGFTHTISESEKFEVKLLSSYTTYFDGGNEARSHNIRLAASLINGTVLQNGEVFSFNKTVGQRTIERGFKSAAIIENGEFVEGVGGGVCQVSTTLYNACLLSGCTAVEYHPHSLAVSYVPPSRDAMVSGTFFDLKIENTTGSTVYIKSVTGKNFVCFKVYGRDFGIKYDINSFITGTIEAPEEFTDDIELVREGRSGTISEGYLSVTKNGYTHIIFLRRDKYSPQKKITLKTAEEIDENPENNLPF